MGINKHSLHRAWVRIRPISHWYLLAACIVFMTISLLALRQNNLNAIKLRDKVIATDEANGDVEATLRELREYVHSHMNARLSGGPNAIYPPIQLKFRYERLLEAEKERVSTVNEKVYSEAQGICEQRFPTGLSGGGRVPCIEQYVTENGAKEKPIPESLYKFDFISPVWSPDVAGWTLILAMFTGLLFAVRLALEVWFRYELKQ